LTGHNTAISVSSAGSLGHLAGSFSSDTTLADVVVPERCPEGDWWSVKFVAIVAKTP
jgi:hypothetical protein